MKKQILTIITCFLLVNSNAQFSKSAHQNEAFNNSFSAIVLDYSNNFVNIQSTELTGNVSTNIFKSTICLPSALHCTIERYSSVEDKSASWQGVLFSGENYKEALDVYKNTFREIKNCVVKGIDDKPVLFTGNMEKTDENIRFTVSSLKLKAKNKQYENFIAEIELTSNMIGWDVKLNLYKKKADTEGNLDEQ